MKKTFSLLLVLLLLLGLCACGGNTDVSTETDEAPAPEAVLLPKEVMLSNALQIDDYEAEFAGNKLRAEEKYLGNTYLVTGTITAIERDHITMQSFGSSGLGFMDVAMDTETIMELTTGQRVQIVGIFDSYTEEEIPLGYGFSETAVNVAMTNGYLVTDRFEISGLLRMYYMSFRDIDGRTHNQYGDESAWRIGLDVTDDNVIEVNFSLKDEIPVEHVDGKDITSVSFGGREIRYDTRVTVSAKVIGGNLVDAELISVDE